MCAESPSEPELSRLRVYAQNIVNDDVDPPEHRLTVKDGKPAEVPRAQWLWVSNSSSRGDWELDEVPAVRDPAHMIQVRRDHGVSTADG
jgi:hypothetical protein